MKLDKATIQKIKKMDFPRTFNDKAWEKYLHRPLTDEEAFYLEDFRTESRFNEYIVKLHEQAKLKNLYIPYLTGLYGNCMFESLEHHNLFTEQEEFRKNLAYIMYIYKDTKNLFSEQECSLAELFSFTNEVEYVSSKNTKQIIKYNYDAMCQDLANEFSWTRLPTQLIMMVISLFFKVKFHIISNNNDYEHIINTSTEENLIDIYLGHIEELHYVPLEVRKGNQTENIVPKHVTAKNNFYKWAVTIWNSKNEILFDDSLSFDDKVNENINEVDHKVNEINESNFMDLSDTIDENRKMEVNFE